jgi:glutathione S-transferase
LQLTFADILIFEAFETAVERDAAVLDKFPKIKAVRAKVEALPKIKAYLSKRTKTPF